MPEKKRHQAAEAPAENSSGLDELLTRPLPEAGRTERTAGQSAPGLVLGRIRSVTAEGVFIEAPGLEAASVEAISLCPLAEEDVGRVCAVQFVGGDRNRPCILGCLVEGGASGLAGALKADGQRLLIQAEREIELRCGESVILMKRNGVIEIRGNYVTSQAAAAQRIRGGSVHVN